MTRPPDLSARSTWPHARTWAVALLVLPLIATAQPQRPDPQRPGPPQRSAPHRSGPQQWQDVRHGHSRVYPVTGQVVGRLPDRARVVGRNHSRYWFADGVWYVPRGGRYVVTRPPHGLVIGALPAFATVVTIGALTYYYANNVYYRPMPDGRYEVVPPPETEPLPMPPSERTFVYPRQGQSAEQQAGDEYECHRWATGQSGFDPTMVATGQGEGSETQRQDYRRATTACLEGRGYTVR